MENIDPQMAQRVWQRVTASTAPQSLKPLVYTVRETAQMYQRLSQQVSGASAERLRQMAAQERRTAAVLCGIGHLRGEKLQAAQQKMLKEQDRMLPEKCCRRALQLARELDLRSGDGEFGALFSMLAQQERENVLFLLALLGERT